MGSVLVGALSARILAEPEISYKRVGHIGFSRHIQGCHTDLESLHFCSDLAVLGESLKAKVREWGANARAVRKKCQNSKGLPNLNPWS